MQKFTYVPSLNVQEVETYFTTKKNIYIKKRSRTKFSIFLPVKQLRQLLVTKLKQEQHTIKRTRQKFSHLSYK